MLKSDVATFLKIFMFTLPLSMPSIGWGQEAIPHPIEMPATPLQVDVRGTKDPDWKPYRTMVKGVTTFQANRTLAPLAQLHFILRPVDSNASLKGVTLRLASEDSSIDIPLSEDGIFDLPNDRDLVAANAELILNRKKNAMRWRPYIRTPGLLPNQRRLGDLRMECNIIWAVEYEDVPFLMRNVFRMIGGPCKSAKISVFFDADQQLSAAKISSGLRQAPLVLGINKRTFMPPLEDASWNDDTLIELTPAHPPFGG